MKDFSSPSICMKKLRRPETPSRPHHRRLQEVVLIRSIRFVPAAAALALVALAAGCENNPQPQTAQNQQGQFPQGQYPQGQGQYPQQQYPQGQ